MQNTQKQAMAFTKQSLALRGNNGNAKNGIKFTNNQNLLTKLQTLQQQTGKPVYLIGTISSLNLPTLGKQNFAPLLHAFWRVNFGIVARVLNNNKITNINPASPYTFARAIGASKAVANTFTHCNCPNNAVPIVKANPNAFSLLHNANKASCINCCAAIMVNYPLGLYSGGVQQELGWLKTLNPNAPIYHLSPCLTVG